MNTDVNKNTEVDNVKKAIPTTELTKDIAVRKAFDFIRENAKITEVDAPSEKKPAAKKAPAKKPAAKKAPAKKAPAKKVEVDKNAPVAIGTALPAHLL